MRSNPEICIDCKHYEIHPTEEPCFSCFGADSFERISFDEFIDKIKKEILEDKKNGEGNVRTDIDIYSDRTDIPLDDFLDVKYFKFRITIAALRSPCYVPCRYDVREEEKRDKISRINKLLKGI